MADQNIKVKIDLDITEFNKHAKELSDAISKVLGKDIDLFNGKIKQTATNANQASDAMGKAAGAAGKAGNAVKQSNQQWTSLALVIQDLPYGFRGIQNNLPALGASVAGFAGPAYLAFSAIVAAITAYDMGLFGATKTTDNFAKSLKEVNDEFRKTRDYTTSQEANLESLVRVGLNLNNSEEVRANALRDIKKILGDTNKAEADKITTIEQAINPVKLYTEALKKKNSQEVISKQITELNTKILEQQANIDLAKSVDKRNPGLLKRLFGYSNISEMELELTTAKGLLRTLEGALDQANKKTFKNPFAEKTDQKTAKPDIDTSYLERLKEEQRTYKDNLGMFFNYGSRIINEEERIAVERAKINGTYNQQAANMQKAFEAKRLSLQQDFGRQIIADADKNTKAYEEIEAKIKDVIIKGREDIADAIAKINADINKDNIKNVNDELNVTIRGVGRNYRAQKEAYEMAIAKLKEKKAALDAANISTTEYADAIGNLETRMSGLVDPLETLNQSLQSIFDNLKIDLLVGFGEALGTALSGGEFDLTSLATILADALSSIGKALISYAILSGAAMETLKDPTKWPIALAAGIAAIAAGAALKSKINEQKTTKFANGGIVSGPTMGLVGEYPGAKSNPEVIAPLDKLKGMLGGQGGGTFVLRGQDLLLATNRAQKASNLKGQNISLA